MSGREYKYSSLRRFFHVLFNQLRYGNKCLTWLILRVVVVGDERVGKSTVIASLAGLPSPVPTRDAWGMMATQLDPTAVEVL